MNRFFKLTDPKIKKLGKYNIPSPWWSRFYEYAFCQEYINKKDIVLDAGCGLDHPLKNYLGDNCKKVIAIDCDPKISNFKNTDTIEYIQSPIQTFKYNRKFDKIFCISVLEHLSEKIVQETLLNFESLMGMNSELIITADYPSMDLTKMLYFIEQANLELTSEFDYSQDDILVERALGLSVYALRIRKKKSKRRR